MNKLALTLTLLSATVAAALSGERVAAPPRYALRQGQAAPAFRLQAASGNPVALQDLRSKGVYLDFWFTGCHSCMAEAPAAVSL